MYVSDMVHSSTISGSGKDPDFKVIILKPHPISPLLSLAPSISASGGHAPGPQRPTPPNSGQTDEGTVSEGGAHAEELPEVRE